jgi:hypothetical protein
MRTLVKILKLLMLSAILSGLAYYGWGFLRPRAASRVVAATVSSAPTPSPTALPDPLRPEAPALLDTERRARADWVKARPAFQQSRSTAERGGVEPCATQAVDTSSLADSVSLGRGRLSWPRAFASSRASQLPLVIHLHGDEPVRRELIESGAPFALLTVTLPVSQSYAPLFNGPNRYRALVTDVEQLLSKRLGRAIAASNVVLSAWSAGFVGIESALFQADGKGVDAVVLIDGLHAPRKDRAAFEAQLEPFVDYARRAADGQRFMFISHSSIDPPDFASTTECVHYLLAALGVAPQAVKRSDRFGLDLVEFFSRGDLHVRGYAGNGKADHCAQLALLRDVYRLLGQRWAVK